MPSDQQKEILKQILDFISYVYDQQTQTPQQPEQKSNDAFGVWKPNNLRRYLIDHFCSLIY